MLESLICIEGLEFNVLILVSILVSIISRLGNTMINKLMFLFLLLIHRKSKSSMLGTLELFISTNGSVFQSNWQIPEQRPKCIAKEHLISEGESKDETHNDALAFASHLPVLVLNQEEQSDQTNLHDIETSEELGDGPRE
jgi:hypothetical protein